MLLNDVCCCRDHGGVTRAFRFSPFVQFFYAQYNQKYIKGREGHDWLLRKNIWRRMRYRRENKKMVQELKGEVDVVALVGGPQTKHAVRAAAAAAAAANTDGADAAAHAAAVAASDMNLADQAAVEAAVAAAESFGKLDNATADAGVSMEGSAVHAALNAAAQLAAAGLKEDDDSDVIAAV